MEKATKTEIFCVEKGKCKHDKWRTEQLPKQYSSMENASVQEKWEQIECEIRFVMDKHIPQKTAAKQKSLLWFKTP